MYFVILYFLNVSVRIFKNTNAGTYWQLFGTYDIYFNIFGTFSEIWKEKYCIEKTLWIEHFGKCHIMNSIEI